MISPTEVSGARSLVMSCVTLSLIACCFAFFAQEQLSFLRPWALLAGCAFSIVNIVFYRYVSAMIVYGASSMGAALMLLLKLPALIVLLLVLSQQSMTFIANAIAGSLVFIPAALLAAMWQRGQS